jgi:hypothetical protein
VELQRREPAGAPLGDALPLPEGPGRHGEGDIAFLKHSFGKLLANFTWWVNRKDRLGKDGLGLSTVVAAISISCSGAFFHANV